MSSKAFSFCITDDRTSQIDAIVAEAIRLTPKAAHFVPSWYKFDEDNILSVCVATPDDVVTLLNDIAIFAPVDMPIKWIIIDIATSYISDIASHAFD